MVCRLLLLSSLVLAGCGSDPLRGVSPAEPISAAEQLNLYLIAYCGFNNTELICTKGWSYAQRLGRQG